MNLITPTTDEDFARYYDLRWQVLRAPFDAPRGSERDELDRSSHHAMVVGADGQPIAVGRLHFNSTDEAQIRYMAVADAARRRGCGRRIVEHLEGIARDRGATAIVLNARDEIVGFYTALGYERIGPGPTLFGTVTHSRMRKLL